MKSVFLDANVLFSAAYKPESALLEIWQVRGVRLHSSAYAVEEARRNLREKQGLGRLAGLLELVTVVAEADVRLVPASVLLREKDRPILAAAVASGMNVLVTGDSRDFGSLFGKTVAGVLVLRPRDFLSLMEAQS